MIVSACVAAWRDQSIKAIRFQQQVQCQAHQQQLHELGPDISQLKPHLQMQWDQAANAHLSNVIIKQHSARKVQWVCDQCPDGHPHLWTARVYSRTQGTKCPYCAGTAVCAHNSLATLAPGIALDWDYANNSLTPHDYTAQSNLRVCWACCTCQHSWKAVIKNRVQDNTQCPECARKARQGQPMPKKPTVAEAGLHYMLHWDHERNAQDGVFPGEVTLGSGKKVHWVCHGCPQGLAHRWCVTPDHRFGGHRQNGCPCCTGNRVCKCNSLQSLCPNTAAEWDHVKNTGKPDDYTASSAYMAWWSTSLRGSWQQTIRGRTGYYLRYASKSLQQNKALP